MFPISTFWIWTRGQITGSHTLGLNPGRRYLLTAGITAKQGAEFAHVLISTLCIQRSPDQVLCGIRDDPTTPPDPAFTNLQINEFLSSATRVTVKLRSTGGLARAEGVLYDIS